MLIIFDLDDTLYDRSGQVRDEHREEDIQKITVFPGVIDFLRTSTAKKILLTKETDLGLQEAKINTLKIGPFFDKIIICHSDTEKKIQFQNMKKRYPAQKIWSVGDRLDTDILFAKEQGFATIQLKHGKYKNLPANDANKPDYIITTFAELNNILSP